MDAERWLRPRARIALVTASAVVIGLWSLLASFTVYALVWWPEHAMLRSTVAHALRGTAMLSMISASPFAFAWLWIRRVAWHVGADGIAVYRRGRLKRSIDWPEITTLHVLPFYAVVRSAARPFGEEILWLGGGDVSWLREVAKDRLGKRSVT
jgi:hypothetical protein